MSSLLYFGNPSTPPIRAAMSAGEFGCIITPGGGSPVPEGAAWCADNGCFGNGWPGTERWLSWISRVGGDTARCWFAAAPDVVGDAAATIIRSAPVLPMIRAAGLPAAFVAQDGVLETRVPWDDFDVLFLGGTDDFKLGPQAAEISGLALARGKRLHCGRVNSIRRLRIAKRYGCQSVDGTYFTKGPDINLVRMRRFMRIVEEEMTLWA